MFFSYIPIGAGFSPSNQQQHLPNLAGEKLRSRLGRSWTIQIKQTTELVGRLLVCLSLCVCCLIFEYHIYIYLHYLIFFLSIFFSVFYHLLRLNVQMWNVYCITSSSITSIYNIYIYIHCGRSTHVTITLCLYFYGMPGHMYIQVYFIMLL